MSEERACVECGDPVACDPGYPEDVHVSCKTCIALRAVLPPRIGLCPLHAAEFYYPLVDGETDFTCPSCQRQMAVYERVPA